MSTAVKQMQQALKVYAQGTGYTAADPGAVDGVVGNQTINAVIAMVPLLPGLPDEIKALAPLGPLIMTNADARNRAKSFITAQASKIHSAIIGLGAYQIAVGKTPTSQTPPSPPRWLPVGPTSGGSDAPPVGAGTAIYFYDRGRNMYRVAVPGAGGYVEVAPSATRPLGNEVTKTQFLTAIGQWYATWWGIGLIAASGTAATLTVVAVARR